MQSGKNGSGAGNATIKDISTRLNVSATSVHRALLGKEGVSESLRELILATADEMGYERNYMASAIKRKAVRVAVVMPQDDGLYYEYIWRGIRDMAKSLRVLNVEIEEFVCRDECHQAQILKEIADAGLRKYAGVVAFCYLGSAKVMYQLVRLTSMKICTVLVDDEVSEVDDVCSIAANTRVIGNLAGELTAMVTPDRGTVLVSEGRTDSQILVNKVVAFREYLNRNRPGLDVRVISGFSGITRLNDNDTVYDKVLGALKKNPDTVLYYALTSADNQFVVRAVEELGMQKQVRVIATDLNRETAGYLRNGQVCAVLNQGAYDKGCASLQLVADYVIKNDKPPRKMTCPINLIFQSNLDLYENTI